MEKIIVSLFATMLFCDFYYIILFRLIDYTEKGNHRKTYKIGLAKFFMIRYKKKIAPTWEEERELRKKGIKREKCPINSSTISQLSFWVQVIHLICVIAFISVGILYAIFETKSLTTAAKTMNIVYFVFIVISYIAYLIRTTLIEKDNKSINNKE